MSEIITAHYLDVDRTAVDGPTDVHTIEALVQIGAIDARHDTLLAEISALQGLDYIRAVASSFYELTHDIPEDAITEAAGRAAMRWLHEMYPAVKEDLAARSGDALLVVSHGPHASIKKFGELLGATGAIGRNLEHYRTQAKPSKVELLVDLGRSLIPPLHFGKNGNVRLGSAYGDSLSDLNVLAMADDPVVVNPLESELERTALEQGWRIIRPLIPSRRKFGDLAGNILRQV